MSKLPSRPANPSPRGFTLIEALATLVLIAIVIPAALRGITVALSLGSHTACLSEATLLAQSKMSELLATGSWQDEGTQFQGDFQDEMQASRSSLSARTANEARSYRWVATVEEWLDPSIQELTVYVIWDWRNRERQVKLSTLVYKPEDQ
jgi:prepilin-type N-terminal cleavage/methylation domain-containing protein